MCVVCVEGGWGKGRKENQWRRWTKGKGEKREMKELELKGVHEMTAS